MNIDVARLLFCVAVSVASWLVLHAVRGRPLEIRLLDRLTAGVFAVRVVGALLLYVLVPDVVRHSDAIAFYLPQPLALLADQGTWRLSLPPDPTHALPWITRLLDEIRAAG